MSDKRVVVALCLMYFGNLAGSIQPVQPLLAGSHTATIPFT
jgi:hypothetical protein